MATTPQDLQAQEQEFASAFAEPDVQRPEVDEDAAFGLSVPDEPAADTVTAIDSDDKMKTNEEAAIDDAAQAAAEEGAQPTEGDATGGEEMAAEAGAAEGDPAGDDMPTDPKELQRMKSWEGRLKARERELEARAAELEALAAKPKADDVPAGDDDDDVAEAGGEGGENQAIEAVEAAVEAVQDGEMTAEQAMATLTEDFGPEFARMLKVLIKAEAGQMAGKVSEDIDSLVAAIKDDKARSHFEAISEAHPDFNELSNSEDMTSYLDSLDEQAKAEAMRVIENGSTRQVIRMLDQFKDWRAAQNAAPAEDPPVDDPAPAQAQPAGPSEDQLNAAEGVRSTGLRLPDQPARSDDYEAAWSQF